MRDLLKKFRVHDSLKKSSHATETYAEDIPADKPLINHGYGNLSEAPGLAVELNDEVLKQHLDPKDKTYFLPTPEWNEKRSWDRLWS